MHLRQEKVVELLIIYFNGNYRRFAKTIGIDHSQLHRYICKGIGGGKKVIGGVMNFCKKNNLNYEDYIEL